MQYFIASEGFAAKRDLRKYKSRADVIVVEDGVFARVSDTKSPQGILAVCDKRAFSFDALMSGAMSGDSNKNKFILIGERINDPGNLGTLIRTAAAAGCDFAVFSRESADVYGGKAIRATAGAVFTLPVVTDAHLPDVITSLQRENVAVLAAHLSGSVFPYTLDLRKSCAVMVGNEANGLSDEVTALADFKVKIPIGERVESLNAGIASGVLLYEVVRQRLV